MRVYEVAIPRSLNDGRPVPEAVVAAFRRLILDEFGGFTIVPDCYGGWRSSDGRDVVEAIDLYVVATDRADADDRMRELAADAARIFEQEAVFYTVAPKEAHLVEREVALAAD